MTCIMRQVLKNIALLIGKNNIDVIFEPSFGKHLFILRLNSRRHRRMYHKPVAKIIRHSGTELGDNALR